MGYYEITQSLLKYDSMMTNELLNITKFVLQVTEFITRPLSVYFQKWILVEIEIMLLSLILRW